MTTPARRPGPKSTLDDAKQQLLVAAIELLHSRGVDIDFGDVKLSETIEAAGIARSTAYRALAEPDLTAQAALHRELLMYLLTRYTQTDQMQSVERAIADELERQRDNLASNDIADRTAAMRAIIRIGAAQSYRGVVTAPERSILTAVYGALRSSGVSDWRLEALTHGEHSLTDLFAALYRDLATVFGYRIKEHFTFEQFATAGASLIEGMAMRDGINTHLVLLDRPTGPDGNPEPWTLFGTAFEALFVGFFEPEDPTDPFADLARH